MTRETYWNCRFSRRGGPIADGHWKELPHHFFNRQSAISPPWRDNENLVLGCGYAALQTLDQLSAPNLLHGLVALNRRQA